jgi:hypothetical protein
LTRRPVGFARSDRRRGRDSLARGVAGLVRNWERVVTLVEAGYPHGLEDYRKDMDTRQLLQNALAMAPARARLTATARVRHADARIRACLSRSEECLWGDLAAAREGWTAERNWWYFELPAAPGPVLRLDLEGW